MKSVGKQLEEARLAKNWTPELAARETKIKVDRVRDLEADDYSNFSSPTYARGFVRTYARALGLDEYRVLRQLDNKLPEDDNASFAPDSGMPYVPEPSPQALHVSSAPRTGLYVVLGMGCAVIFVIGFVMLEAYRAGELPRYFASTSSSDNTSNIASANPAPPTDSEAPPHALPVDPNDTTHSVRALPVDLNALNASAPASPQVTPASPNAASPVVIAPDTNASSVAVAPVNAPALAAAPSTAAAVPVTTAAPASPAVTGGEAAPALAVTTKAPPDPAPALASSPSTPAPAVDPTMAASDEKAPPRALPVDPRDLVADAPAASPINPVAQPVSADAPATGDAGTPVDLSPAAPPTNSTSTSEPHGNKRLVLTASRDSFVRVMSLDSGAGNSVLYNSVLRRGQSLTFDGRKFSVNVAIPSAVDIIMDGVYYGPHSDHESPETFTLESHQP